VEVIDGDTSYNSISFAVYHLRSSRDEKSLLPLWLMPDRNLKCHNGKTAIYSDVISPYECGSGGGGSSQRNGKSWQGCSPRHVMPESKFIDWRMSSSGMWRRVALVRTDISEDRIASIIRVKLLVTSNVPSSPIFHCNDGGDTLSEMSFLQGPQGVTSQKTAYFIVTAVRTSNLT
jgi:hypothetical protein